MGRSADILGKMALKKKQVVGRRIKDLVQTKWVCRKGRGTPGIGVGDGNQYSAEFFIVLDSGVIVELDRDTLREGTHRTKELRPLDHNPSPKEKCLGQTIVEVVIDEDDELAVVLSNGILLSEEGHPSGNGLILWSMSEMNDEDKQVKYSRFWEGDSVIPWELDFAV